MRKRSIASTSRIPIVFLALSTREFIKTGTRLVKDIVYYFFFLQFQTRFRIKKRLVVNVDHPLDDTIPFCPGDVKKYMSFIPLWMKSLSYFRISRGRGGNSRTIEFLSGLAGVYREAGLIYDRCQSTTSRPAPIPHPLFLMIHFLDPHLHCVPSLHVGVVLYNYLKMRTLLVENPSLKEEKPEDDIEYTRREAMEIIDTILTVKQHSINCVAAGLYYIHVLYPEFSRLECEEVIGNLLESRKGEIPRLPEIRKYVKNLFNEFLGKHDKMDQPDFRTVILEFLETYQKKEVFPEGAADERG